MTRRPIRLISEAACKLAAEIRREVRARLGPNSTFEERRDAAAGLASDALWQDADVDLRAAVTTAEQVEDACPDRAQPPPPSRMPWAELVRRVFREDLPVCPRCTGGMQVIATITDPAVVVAILTHVGALAEVPARAPPQVPLWPGGCDPPADLDAYEPDYVVAVVSSADLRPWAVPGWKSPRGSPQARVVQEERCRAVAVDYSRSSAQ